MGEPYIGEIRIFAGNFAPAGWMFCEGQLLPISENDALFTLIGTTYGGDGQSTFALPDLRGRIPIHFGSGKVLAEAAGSEEITLTVQQIPSHNHGLLCNSNVGAQSSPSGNFYASSGTQLYADPPVAAPIGMKATLVGGTGGSQPHENFAPYLCVNFILSLFGRFPSQT